MSPPVVDAHHHLWDPSRADYPFLTDELAAIRRPFGVGDLVPLLDAAGVAATVLVQTRSSTDESREFLAAAAATPRIAGVIAWVDLTSDDVAGAIDALRAAPGGERLAGIRHQVHDEPNPAWILRDDVRRGLRAVAASGLPYDLLVRALEMPAALEVVRSMPDLRFVIDHLGKPPIRNGDIATWAERIAPFGRLPNVWCKLSGLVTEADWSSWTVADLRPAVDHALDVFGPQRLLLGSDWPVCLLASSYQGVFDATLELIAGLTADEQAAVMGENAIAYYGLFVG
ncbi:MAG TPA: amidohydrolase family protein [Candidatus Limnocylindrales bacterium]